MRGARETGSLLALSSIAADGLGVLADGTVLRVLELAAIAPLRMGPEQLQSTARAVTELAAMLEDRQALQLITIAQPLAISVIARELNAQAAQAGAALERDGLGDRGRAVREQPQSIIAAQYAGDVYGAFVQRHPKDSEKCALAS